MGELHDTEENDFTELQDIFGQKIEFGAEDVEEDTEEVVPFDPEEASREAIKRLFVGIISKDESPPKQEEEVAVCNPVVDEDSEEDSEWI